MDYPNKIGRLVPIKRGIMKKRVPGKFLQEGQRNGTL